MVQNEGCNCKLLFDNSNNAPNKAFIIKPLQIVRTKVSEHLNSSPALLRFRFPAIPAIPAILGMVQGISVSTLTTSRIDSVYASSGAWRSQLGLVKKGHILFGGERQCLWYHPSISFLSQFDIASQRNWRVKAGWLFKGGGDQGLDPSSERSDSATEDIMFLIYQLNLSIQVQYALNVEQYEAAKQLRNELNEVEAEIMKQQKIKRGSGSTDEAQDQAISILRLTGDLQNAIQNENYALAAELRDKISKLEAESLAVSVNAQAYKNVEYAFRLGQKLRHKKFGYRAVVCGMDPVCCESSSWIENAHVDKLTRGPNQPFYQVLVDSRDPNLLLAYVAEENLLAPDQPDKDRFAHPYVGFLFYGLDSAGDFIPIKQLRDKYNRPRHEIPHDPKDDETGEDS